MDHRSRDDIEDWLRAESEGREEDADALFAVAFAQRVPRRAPAPGLADRVVAALANVPAVRPVPGWVRAATLVLLVVGGLASAVVWSAGLAGLLQVGWKTGPRVALDLAALGGTLLHAFARACRDGVAIARTVALVAASGPATAVLAANLLVAFIASLALKRVLSIEEES